MPVVDASVWVALHHGGDRFHARCVRWLERTLLDGGSLVAPALLHVETAAALRRLTRDDGLTREALEETADLGLVELIPLTVERARQAAAVAVATGVRGADAVYLDLARERGDVLISLDRQQLERGAAVARVEQPA